MIKTLTSGAISILALIPLLIVVSTWGDSLGLATMSESATILTTSGQVSVVTMFAGLFIIIRNLK